MTPDMMCITDLEGRKLQGDRDPSSEMLMHLEVYRQRPDVQAVVHAHPPTATGFAVAGIPLDRAVLAEVLTTLGSIPIAEYATPSTRELPEAVRQVHQGARRHAAGEPRRADRRRRSVRRVLQDGDDRALREDQPRGAAARPREPAVARRGRRGCRSCAAPTASRRRRRSAPIRPTDESCRRRSGACQVVQAPAGGGRGSCRTSCGRRPQADGDGEIRLTYRELSALIEDAIRSLR